MIKIIVNNDNPNKNHTLQTITLKVIITIIYLKIFMSQKNI